MKKVKIFLIKTLLCLIIFLSLAILSKSNIQYKYFIQKKLYQETLSFSYFKNIYNKYLGGIFPLDNISANKDTEYVFNEKLQYQDITKYKDGAVLSVGLNYLVPNIEDGTIVYIGEKDEYGNVIILENNNGINVWYGNICNTTIKLYDYLEKGKYLGEACSDKIYLVFSKNNEYLSYQEFIN